MAYDVTNPPVNAFQRIGDGPAKFLYRSADTAATVKGAGYFTNGADLGMRVGDEVVILDTTTPLATLAIVSTVDETTRAATVV
ncbi:hypothetical protein [Brucella sp. IR073]|uniref:hypothetical protein n=1 Tax=unclassified Brucella TaxID=2632610 RepID=UPI003B986D7D